ncbi:MAG TPA: gamma-glutamyltransferase [Chromatiales bacterium]|nr:gamma-glutamyltransferase [Chromatiales bacterium]
MQIIGTIAAGHSDTANAAKHVLREGGNAFDAVIAAMFAACVAEPVLASLGGGGFLLAQPTGQHARLYDFFAHTPKRKLPESDIDFYPITADFGDAQQEFHIGMGSIATPGMVKGAFHIHTQLCSLPIKQLVAPAIELARNGGVVNPFQHYIASIVEPILCSSDSAFALHCAPDANDEFAPVGTLLRQPQMADAFEALALEGESLFYQGEMAHKLVEDSRQNGGLMTLRDLRDYRVFVRKPLTLDYHHARITTNPPPSLGGLLIAFSLSLLAPHTLGDHPFSSATHLRHIARAMRITQRLRRGGYLERMSEPWEILAPSWIRSHLKELTTPTRFTRGTTQISIADHRGNLASMTLSNGEGSGYVLPGTGIMLNNMLGEEDLNPNGFHRWQADSRIASMMAPTFVVSREGYRVATGSGGSNRIRSAILQVISNLVDFDMELTKAVAAPRIHYESGILHLEPERSQETLRQLADEFPKQKLWQNRNLYFGGAHTVKCAADGGMEGSGDPRRGGVSVVVRL